MSRKCRRYEHDPITSEVEGFRQGRDPDPAFTPEAKAILKAKLAEGMGTPLHESVKFRTASKKLKGAMIHAAHLRKLRTLRSMWNPDDES